MHCGNLKWRLAAQRVDDKGEKIKQAFTFSDNILILPKNTLGVFQPAFTRAECNQHGVVHRCQ